MLHLAAGLYDTIFGEQPCNILIIGAEGSGKSTLTEQLRVMWAPTNQVTHSPNREAVSRKTVRPTVGLNMSRVHDKHRHANIALWDLGGQPSLRPLWLNYYAQCHGVMFVVDMATLHDRREELSLITKHLLTQRHLLSAPLCIVLNKCDTVITDGDGAASSSSPPHSGTAAALSRRAAMQHRIARAMDDLSIIDHLLFASSALFDVSNNNSDCSGGGDDDNTLTTPSKRKDSAVEANKTLFKLKPSKSDDALSSAPPADAEPHVHMIDNPPSEGSSGFGSRVFKCFCVSAVTGEGVREAFEWLLSQCTVAHRQVVEEDK